MTERQSVLQLLHLFTPCEQILFWTLKVLTINKQDLHACHCTVVMMAPYS